MTEKKKIKRYTTPKAKTMWAYFVTPDEYKGEKNWKVDLVLETDSPECAELTELIDKLAQEAYDEQTKKLKPAQKKQTDLHVPYKAELDDNTGEETGRTIFKFKSKAEVEDKHGKIRQIAIGLFDDEGKPVKDTSDLPTIGNGSVVKVNWYPFDFYNSATKSAGISMRINAVQLIDIVSFGGDASEYGFGDESDGDNDEPFGTSDPNTDANDF